MFGLVLGTLCLIALIATLRRRRHGRHMFAHGYGYGRYGGVGYGPWMHHGYGLRMRGGFMRPLFERLDTTPGQEKAISHAVDALREHMSGTREELNAARKELATAIGGDVIDGAALDAALARQTTLLTKLGRGLTQALLSVHEALDGKQRKALAELVAHGGRGAGLCGLHRGAW